MQTTAIKRLNTTSTLSAMRFDENTFTCQCEKQKRFKGFKFHTFISRFQVAVKGLIYTSHSL